MSKPGIAGDQLRVEGVLVRGREVRIFFDGRPLVAYEGESVAAALLAAGQRVFRWTAKTDEPRSPFCGIGVCFECLVVVDGLPGVRACRTPVRDGMHVETQKGWGTWNLNP